MNSKDRLIGVTVVWAVFGLFAGIICHQNGVQVEDILLTALLAVVVLLATAELAGENIVTRLRAISTYFPPFDR
ncbi:MAG: hypothetical protein IPM16_18440 [Chloroflexi bacterium]|nr:hypothetical protein [Chloroflexota bacterium]